MTLLVRSHAPATDKHIEESFELKPSFLNENGTKVYTVDKITKLIPTITLVIQTLGHRRNRKLWMVDTNNLLRILDLVQFSSRGKVLFSRFDFSEASAKASVKCFSLGTFSFSATELMIDLDIFNSFSMVLDFSNSPEDALEMFLEDVLMCQWTGWRNIAATQQLRRKAPMIRVAPLKPYSSCRYVTAGGTII